MRPEPLGSQGIEGSFPSEQNVPSARYPRLICFCLLLLCTLNDEEPTEFMTGRQPWGRQEWIVSRTGGR